MTTSPHSRLGQQLYRLLPAVYREKDNGDLAAFLDACGDILDQIQDILDQRLDDTFPETCQTWLIPYFAQLFDVRLMSPSEAGQRKELENGVAWRQKKGTPLCVEDIAEAVGNTQVEIQEGWRRLAVTPRLNQPLLSPRVFGADINIHAHHPVSMARHPGLAAGTLDLRFISRAMQVPAPTPASKLTDFRGRALLWQHTGLKGTPCFPGRYEDVSVRTVDLRTPDSRRGHYHPKRILLHYPLPDGFFPPHQPDVDAAELQSQAELIAYREVEESIDDQMILHRYYSGIGPLPVKISGTLTLDDEPPGVDDIVYHFDNVYFKHTLTIAAGRLSLDKVAAFKVIVHSHEKTLPVLYARDSLIRDLQVASGYSKLEYCTVLHDTISEILNASDCLFLSQIRKDLAGDLPPLAGCIRYSRVPADLALGEDRLAYCTRDVPIFFSRDFGEPGCAVLAHEAPRSICAGAEDGGEMGAYHHRHFCLGREAVQDKLNDFLPVGMIPVLIPDARLNVPPAIQT